MCPELPNPDNGVIRYSEDSLLLNALATYDCDDGYGLYGGDEIRVCSPDLDENGDVVAMWDGMAPECLRK